MNLCAREDLSNMFSESVWLLYPHRFTNCYLWRENSWSATNEFGAEETLSADSIMKHYATFNNMFHLPHRSEGGRIIWNQTRSVAYSKAVLPLYREHCARNSGGICHHDCTEIMTG